MKPTDLCVLCLATRAETERPGLLSFYWTPPTWPPHPSHHCTHGSSHIFPEAPARPPSIAKKRDAKLCLRCGLHPKNPAASTNGCAHVFEPETR